MSLDPQPVDLKQLQRDQLAGNVAADATGSEDSTYHFPEHESHLVHLKLVKKVNVPGKKRYDTEERIVKLNPDQYARMANEKYNAFAEYDEQVLLHDPRPKASKQAAEEGVDPATGQKDPLVPNKQIRSTQDAQLRYEELFGEKPSGDLKFAELKELIKQKESESGEDSDSDDN